MIDLAGRSLGFDWKGFGLNALNLMDPIPSH